MVIGCLHHLLFTIHYSPTDMQEIRRRKVSGLGLRIAAPKLGRALALLLLAAGVAAVAISYWRLKDRTTFRLRLGQAPLSTEVVGVIDHLEHREMKGERLWVLLKADRDVRYSDGHHQLENVYLEVYPDQGDRSEERRVGKECRSRWS